VAPDKPVQFANRFPSTANSASFWSGQNVEALTDMPVRVSVELPKNGDCAAKGGSLSNWIDLERRVVIASKKLRWTSEPFRAANQALSSSTGIASGVCPSFVRSFLL
jgi:hypothetical protein